MVNRDGSDEDERQLAMARSAPYLPGEKPGLASHRPTERRPRRWERSRRVERLEQQLVAVAGQSWTSRPAAVRCRRRGVDFAELDWRVTVTEELSAQRAVLAAEADARAQEAAQSQLAVRHVAIDDSRQELKAAQARALADMMRRIVEERESAVQRAADSSAADAEREAQRKEVADVQRRAIEARFEALSDALAEERRAREEQHVSTERALGGKMGSIEADRRGERMERDEAHERLQSDLPAASTWRTPSWRSCAPRLPAPLRRLGAEIKSRMGRSRRWSRSSTAASTVWHRALSAYRGTPRAIPYPQSGSLAQKPLRRSCPRTALRDRQGHQGGR